MGLKSIFQIRLLNMMKIIKNLLIFYFKLLFLYIKNKNLRKFYKILIKCKKKTENE